MREPENNFEKRVAEQKLHKFDVSSTSVDIIKKSEK